MVSLLTTLNSEFPVCHTIYAQIVLTGCKQLYFSSGTDSLSFKDGEAGINCWINTVPQSTAYIFTPPGIQGCISLPLSEAIHYHTVESLWTLLKNTAESKRHISIQTLY